MLVSNTIILALAATATALPQFSWPSRGTNTANDVTNKAPCKAITVIFARGTGEGGNIGSVIGPPLLKALQSKAPGQVNYQGVPYPATAAGNAQQGGTGGSLMTSLAKQALQQCPSTKIVLSGYSQGGFVVHRAAASLGSSPPAAAVIFGDPQNGQAVANVPAARLKQYCARGDGVCSTPRTFRITSAHLSYGNNADDAADFVIAATGV
ncbi:MAG: hypothetical protein LQ348_005739 [Seirophora lacunosa]|nr:MAG: hypothetical protein LQ348_005739 [Seirophora lacunosa]